MSLTKKLKNFAAASLIGITSCGPLITLIPPQRNFYYPSAVEVYQSENVENSQEALETDRESALVYPGGKITIRFSNPLWGLFPTSIYTTNEVQDSTNLDIYVLEIENKEIKQRIYALSKEFEKVSSDPRELSSEVKLGDAVKSSNYKANAVEIINQGPNVLRLDAIMEFEPI